MTNDKPNNKMDSDYTVITHALDEAINNTDEALLKELANRRQLALAAKPARWSAQLPAIAASLAVVTATTFFIFQEQKQQENTDIAIHDIDYEALELMEIMVLLEELDGNKIDVI